jgi:hypothetical protein
VPVEDPKGEVESRVRGQLGPYSFRRAWKYWVVNGDVPLDVARELYSDPVGETDIRVAGHCGCPAPAYPWVQWKTEDGRMVLSIEQQKCSKEYVASGGFLAKVAQQILDTCTFSDDPVSVGAKGYVTLYHIDSELGLYIFVQALKRHELA